jgi:hypothetical protein
VKRDYLGTRWSKKLSVRTGRSYVKKCRKRRSVRNSKRGND